MSTRNVAIVVALAVVALLAGAYVLWPEPGDEDQVREAIRAVAEGARQADVAATLATVSDRYADERGVTRDELRLYLFREYQRRGPITVMLSDIEVTIAGELAMAEFSATLADGVDVGRLDFLPGSADTLHFVADLQREGGEWRITGSKTTRRDGAIAGPR